MRTAVIGLCLLGVLMAPAAHADEFDERTEYEVSEERLATRNAIHLLLPAYSATLVPAIAHGTRAQLGYERFWGEGLAWSAEYRMGVRYSSRLGAFPFLGLGASYWLGAVDDVRFAFGPTVDVGIGRTLLLVLGLHTALRLPVARHFALELPVDLDLTPGFLGMTDQFGGLLYSQLAVSVGLKLVFPF